MPIFFLVDVEREEETEGAVVSSSVLQRAGSALQSAPPLHQGEERANGAAVDEDEEEGVCVVDWHVVAGDSICKWNGL